jgi:hypothetical protein
MSSMRFNARLDTSHHGPPHPFKDAGVVADSSSFTFIYVCERNRNVELCSDLRTDSPNYSILDSNGF